MTYWPISKSGYVGVIQPANKLTEVPTRKHHMWIYDRSGSMDWVLSTLAEDICAHLSEVPLNDFISIGWFSGVSDFRWLVKGARLAGKEDYANVAKVVRANATSRNTTCFSEILASIPDVISDVAPMADSVELAFLTDGHPVVPNQQSERKAIFAALKQIGGRLTSGLFVGYGDYYNRPLLAEMAQSVGATLQHADHITDFGNQLAKIIVKNGRKRTTVQVPVGVDAVFTIENGRVVVYSVDNSAAIVPEGLPAYYVGDSKKVAPSGDKPGKDADKYQPMYATALMYLQRGESDEALNVLSEIGDVALVHKVGSAMTNKEFGDAENAIQEAAINLTMRFLKGQKIGCLPAEDAFDLIDLIGLLQSDKEAKFYPYHPEFSYKRIGRKTKTVDGYPKFEADSSVGVPLSRLVGNAKELNISVGLSIPGTVELPDEINAVSHSREDVGLPKVFKSNIFRTYNIISNALPNVTRLPVSVGYDTFLVLHSEGLVPELADWRRNEVFVIDLLAVPACNRARGKKSADWIALADDAVAAEVIGNQLKVYKAKLAELDPNKESKRPVNVTPEQVAFLAACGIKQDGSYSPPVEVSEPTDVLKIRTFEIKVEKSSSMSIKDFALVVGGTKKANLVASQMLVAHDDIERKMPRATGAAVQWLTEKVDKLTETKRKFDAEIAAAKYAIAIGGYWRKSHSQSSAVYQSHDRDVLGYNTGLVNVTFEFLDDVEKKI
jgi:hypothetical protein